MNTTMRDVPLSLLRSLSAVYSEGGVRPAAKALGVDHSAVSRAIRDLELILGAPLTETSKRGQRMLLTSQGRQLAKTARSAFRDLEVAIADYRIPAGAKNVNIATLPSIATRWLLPRLRRLKAIHPSIEVSIIVDQPRHADVDPNFDLTLHMGARSGSSVGVVILGDDVAAPVMAPSLWNHLGRPKDISALMTTRLLHDRDREVNWERWRTEIGPINLDTKVGPRLTSSDLALQAAELGEGVAICRGRLAAASLAAGKLVCPFGTLSIPLTSAWWLYEGERYQQRQSVRKVREWLMAEFADTAQSSDLGAAKRNPFWELGIDSDTVPNFAEK